MRISGISGDIRILWDIRISSLSQKIKFFRESFNFEGFLTHLGSVFPDLFSRTMKEVQVRTDQAIAGLRDILLLTVKQGIFSLIALLPW